MRTLILSDTHLNGFEEKKYNLLHSLISDADTVILNGDFWEGYGHTFKDFLQSPWRNLFPLLKAKQTVYLYGNHDKHQLSDQNTQLFSIDQRYRYELKVGDTVYVFEHGNRLCPFWDESRTTLDKKMIVETNIGDFIQKIVIKSLGVKAVKILGAKLNGRIKKQLRDELKDNEIYICGHTHIAEFDPQNRFVNIGMFKHGLAQYLILEDGILTPKEEWYA